MEEKSSIPTKSLPMIYLRGKVLLPNNIATIDVGRDKSVKAINYATENGRYIFFATQKNANIENPTANDVYGVGVIGL